MEIFLAPQLRSNAMCILIRSTPTKCALPNALPNQVIPMLYNDGVATVFHPTKGIFVADANAVHVEITG
jgi:hypothetical protein